MAALPMVQMVQVRNGSPTKKKVGSNTDPTYFLVDGSHKRKSHNKQFFWHDEMLSRKLQPMPSAQNTDVAYVPESKIG